MAFKIIINGIVADLKGATKQELVFQNPIFDYEAMTGSYGLPFSLPFSKTNDRIFNNARSEFSAGMPLTYLCEQYLNDSLVAEGLIVLSDTNGAYNCNFTSNLRDIFTPVSGSVRYDGYLRDILPAGPSVATLADRNAMTTWNGIVCYPYIDNPDFFQANPAVGWAGFINDYNTTTLTYQGPVFCPFVSVIYILQQIQSYYGITFNGALFTDTKFNKLAIGTITAEDGATASQIKNAVGDITVAGFLNDLRLIFGAVGDINLQKKTINLDLSGQFFDAETFADWSNICSPILNKIASPYPGGIELNYPQDQEDKWITIDGAYADVFAQYKTTPNSNCRPLSPKILRPLGSNGLTTPNKMNAKGRTSTNNQQNQKITPRIGFFRVISSRPYVLYRNTETNYSIKNYSSSNSRKTINASEETFWQNTFEASFKINLRKLSLSGFDIKSKVHIHGWNYLIKRIVMDCSNPENSLLEAYRA